MKDKNINLQGKHGAENYVAVLQIKWDLVENERHNSNSLFDWDIDR